VELGADAGANRLVPVMASMILGRPKSGIEAGGMGMAEADEALWRRWVELQRRSEGSLIRDLDEVLGTREVERTTTILVFGETQVGPLGASLTELDRELRRTVATLDPVHAAGVDSIFIAGMSSEEIENFYREKLRRGRGRPRPVGTDRAGLKITGAEAGSTQFVVEALGLLVTVLISQPVNAFATALTFLDSWGHIRVWLGQRRDPLAKISARNALQVLREFQVDPGRTLGPSEPNAVISVTPDDFDDHRPMKASIRLPDGTEVAGRRITHVRNNHDGTQDIIHVEG